MPYSTIVTTIWSTIALALCALYVYGVLQIGSFWQEASALADTAVLAEQKQVGVDTQRRVLRELSREGIDLQQYFFSEGNAIDAIEVIEAFGEQQGVPLTVQAVRVAKGEPRDPLAAFIISVEAEGSFDELVALVSRVETLPYAVRIDAYDITNIVSETSNTWRATLSIAAAHVLQQEAKNEE